MSGFASIDELFLSVLESHISASTVAELLANQKTLIDGQAIASTKLSTLIDGQTDQKAQLDRLLVFIGAQPPVATQAQLNTLGALLKTETTAVEGFDQTIKKEKQP